MRSTSIEIFEHLSSFSSCTSDRPRDQQQTSVEFCWCCSPVEL